jgi:hypothetical protein
MLTGVCLDRDKAETGLARREVVQGSKVNV